MMGATFREVVVRRIGRYVLAVAGLALTSVPAEPCAAADLDSIWSEFRQRQSAAEAARLEFTMSQTLPADEVAQRVEPGSGGGQDLSVGPYPASIELSGDKVRFESLTLSFVGGDRGETVPTISAFDGENQQSYSDRSGRPGYPSQGAIKPLAKFREWENTALLPLFFAVRPLRQEAFGPNPSGWREEDRPAVVGGVRCLVIAKRPPETPPEFGHVIRAYLDPARDFIPLRVESAMRRGRSVRLDVVYERGDPPRWVPSEWSSVWLKRDGTTADETRCSLKDVTLGQPVADERFVITFPAGTTVVDERAGRSEVFVVQPDGSFLAERSARATESSEKTPWPWVIAAIGAVALGLAVLLRRHRASST